MSRSCVRAEGFFMNRKKNSNKNTTHFYKSWEFVLVILLILVFIFDSSLSRKFLNISNLLDTTQIFMEFAIMTLPLTLIIMTGFIDISIGSITALSSVVMGALFRYGMNIWIAAVFAILTGVLAGFFNGIIITKLQIPSIVITLATMIFFRGIAYIILEDNVVTGFPEKFGIFGGTYKQFFVPIQLIIYIVLAGVFGVILHRTKFGRLLYAMGNNENTCRYSGIPVDEIRLILFTISGMMAGFVGVILSSRLGSVRPDIAYGYELKVITIVVLGGVAIFGGKGSLLGVVLATFIIGYINYGFKLINVKEQIIAIITGAILIIVLLVPTIGYKLRSKRMIYNKVEDEGV